ncbi:hypothetical protein ABPG74_004409 [Tetrahymena malaccensis]
MSSQNSPLNIKQYRRQQGDNGLEKQIWFFKRNEQFQENHFFDSDLLKKLLNSEYSNNVLNIHNMKRSLLQIYKEFEYCYYKMEDYLRVDQETNEINNEAILLLANILKHNGIRMLAYESKVPEIYNQIAQISEMFICILYRAKILECCRICIFQQSDSTQIDSLMQNEIEQTFLQKQLIQIFQDNGIVPNHITFYCIEKIKLEKGVQYFLYFDIAEQQVIKQFLNKSLSFGRRFFSCEHKQQENIIYNIINFAIFDQKVFFNSALRQSSQEQNEQIVYKIVGMWPDNIDEVMIAKQNQLFLDYQNRQSEDLQNSFTIEISKNTRDIMQSEFNQIIHREHEYKYFIKLQINNNSQFRYYTQNLSSNQLDLRCLQPLMMQIILEKLFNPCYYEIQQNSFIDSQNSHYRGFLDFLNSNPVQNQHQVINDIQTQRFFQINNSIFQDILYILQLYGLQDLDTININNRKESKQITHEELFQYYNQKNYKFIDFDNFKIKKSLLAFYETFCDLPVLSTEDLLRQLTEQQEIDKREFIQKQQQESNKKKKFQKDQRIMLIDLIKEKSLSSSKQLYFLQEYDEIKDQLRSSQKYQSLQKDEFQLIQNIFIHIFSIQKCKNIFWNKKITLQGCFNGQQPDLDQVRQKAEEFLSFQNQKPKFYIIKYRYDAETDNCYVYFEFASTNLMPHIKQMINRDQIQTNFSLLGQKTIIPIRYLKRESNEIINLIKPEDQNRFSITYYTNPVTYHDKDKTKQVYCQVIGERHLNQLQNKKNEIKNDQCITFLEEPSFLNGDAIYLRDLIEHLNSNHFNERNNSQQINPQFAQSVIINKQQNNHISQFQLLHQSEIQGQIKLQNYYIKPDIKDVNSSYEFYEFNCQNIYDPDWWLTGWPLLYRSVYDSGDDLGKFLFSDDPSYIIQKRQNEKRSNDEIENPYYFYVCSIDPRFGNFQLIQSNHYAKIPSYYCRIRCIIQQRKHSCSTF